MNSKSQKKLFILVIGLFYCFQTNLARAGYYCAVAVFDSTLPPASNDCTNVRFVDDFSGMAGPVTNKGTMALGPSGAIKINTGLANTNPTGSIPAGTANNLTPTKLIEYYKNVIEMKLVSPDPNPGALPAGYTLDQLCNVKTSLVWERPCDYLSPRFNGYVWKCKYDGNTSQPRNIIDQYFSNVDPSTTSTLSTPSENASKYYRAVDCRSPDKIRKR